MRTACVDCHYDHVESTDSDFKEGLSYKAYVHVFIFNNYNVFHVNNVAARSELFAFVFTVV